MSRPPIFICDICGEEVRINTWMDKASKLSIAITVPERNPLAKYGDCQTATIQPEDICWSCASKIGGAIAKALKEIEEAKDADRR